MPLAPLKGVSIHPEWLFAIRKLGKDVENRNYKPTPAMLKLGKDDEWQVALHATASIGGVKGYGTRCHTIQNFVDIVSHTGWSYERHRSEDDRKPWGGTHDPWHKVEFIKYDCATGDTARVIFRPLQEATSAIVAVAKFGSITTDNPSPWAFPGRVHWELKEVKFFDKPIPSRGRQRLWTLSEDQRGKIAEQLEGGE